MEQKNVKVTFDPKGLTKERVMIDKQGNVIARGDEEIKQAYANRKRATS